MQTSLQKRCGPILKFSDLSEVILFSQLSQNIVRKFTDTLDGFNHAK